MNQIHINNGEPDIYTLHLTLKLTIAKGVETSVTTTNANSPSQDYANLDDQLLQTLSYFSKKQWAIVPY